jgi:hypothetical protein
MIEQRASEYLELARELIARGELEQAEAICDGLPLWAEDRQSSVDALRARLALAKDQLELAEQSISALPAGAESSQLTALLRTRQAARLAGRELYNSALATARTGNTPLAALQLASAAAHQPHESTIWLLKLKADLTTRNFPECYADLAALDRLGARPREYTHLEQLLPPISRV